MDHENNIREISFDEDATFESLNSTLTDSQIQELSGEDLNLNYDIKSHHVNKKAHKRELLSRLKRAQNKIKKSEDYMNDISMTFAQVEIHENDLVNLKNLPMYIGDDVNSIIVDIDEYNKKLEKQLRHLDNADEQIIKTTNKVTDEIDSVYDQLICEIIQELNNKRELTKLEVQVFKHESLAPLKACRKEIKSQIHHKKQFMHKLQKMIKNFNPTMNCTDIEQLINSNKDIAGIPAVPLSDELPYLIFKRPSNSAVNEVLNKIYGLGTVLRLGPIQITDIEEKPGSLFVKWDITDTEYSTEEQIFVLQKASGEVFDPVADVFETVYEGSESSCFVRELSVNQLITLRVGIQSLDSAWSTLRVARTRIASYRWSLSNEDYMVTNNGKVAVKVDDNMSTLYSQGPQIDANQIIEFEFFEVPKTTHNDGIVLIDDLNDNNENFQRNGVLMVTSEGKILMNGDEKLMQLPRMRSGGKIVFTISRKDDESLRINIESDNKAVTYDWLVETPLYFATRLSNHKSSVMVK